MRTKVATLRATTGGLQIADQIAEMEPLPGSLVLQFICCGRKGCKCQTGDKHGPYHYRVWREGGRVKKVYVPVTQREQVLLQCALHQSYADLLKRLIAERKRLCQSLSLQVQQGRKEATRARLSESADGGAERAD